MVYRLVSYPGQTQLLRGLNRPVRAIKTFTQGELRVVYAALKDLAGKPDYDGAVQRLLRSYDPYYQPYGETL